LALRWSDFDDAGKALKVERALEQTKVGITYKLPKAKRGRRTVQIDDKLAALLCTEREKMQQLVAVVPDRAAVDLSLVRLPADAQAGRPPRSDADLHLPRPQAGFARLAWRSFQSAISRTAYSRICGPSSRRVAASSSASVFRASSILRLLSPCRIIFRGRTGLAIAMFPPDARNRRGFQQGTFPRKARMKWRRGAAP